MSAGSSRTSSSGVTPTRSTPSTRTMLRTGFFGASILPCRTPLQRPDSWHSSLSLFSQSSRLERRVEPRPEAKYLGTWRGNTKSNRKLRNQFLQGLPRNFPVFLVETTASWLNHDISEKHHYVDVLLSGRFSLCPAGWAAVSFRIYESMALGICPVIIADELVPPNGPVLERVLDSGS